MCAFLESINVGKSVNMLVSNALLSILFIARPKTAIDLPDFSPASAIIFNLPRFDAKDVNSTLPLLSIIIFVIGSLRKDSDFPLFLLSIFVESTTQREGLPPIAFIKFS